MNALNLGKSKINSISNLHNLHIDSLNLKQSALAINRTQNNSSMFRQFLHISNATVIGMSMCNQNYIYLGHKIRNMIWIYRKILAPKTKQKTSMPKKINPDICD